MRKGHLTTAAAAALVFAQPAQADPVTDWWDLASRISNASQGSPMRTPDQDRATTRAALAMFEALNAIDRRYDSYLNFPAGDASASQDAAAATAAYRVLVHHHPAQRTALDESYAIAMAEVRDERARERGRLIGEAAAAAAIAAICAGVVPQQPPTTLTSPSPIHSATWAAVSVAASSYSPRSLGSPAFG